MWCIIYLYRRLCSMGVGPMGVCGRGYRDFGLYSECWGMFLGVLGVFCYDLN